MKFQLYTEILIIYRSFVYFLKQIIKLFALRIMRINLSTTIFLSNCHIYEMNLKAFNGKYVVKNYDPIFNNSSKRRERKE